MSTEDFDSKRPDHPDFMTQGELKKAEFSGMRYNTLSEEVELWLLGEIKKVVTKNELALDPNAYIAMAISEVFKIEVSYAGERPNASRLH
jgi:hypothetical protein